MGGALSRLAACVMAFISRRCSVGTLLPPFATALDKDRSIGLQGSVTIHMTALWTELGGYLGVVHKIGHTHNAV